MEALLRQHEGLEASAVQVFEKHTKFFFHANDCEPLSRNYRLCIRFGFVIQKMLPSHSRKLVVGISLWN
jgi:hypothetical protein